MAAALASTASETNPDTPSSDYAAMLPYWNKVETVLAGADAMRAAGEAYLPKFPKEKPERYDYRRKNAKFTNIYADVVSNLASKPFAEEVTLDDKAADVFKGLAEDIDGRGNNLHVFAQTNFYGGVNNAVDWIVVDFTKARQREDGQPLSLAEEQAQGLRPYWVRVPAKSMLAVYSDTVRGKETFVHARWRESLVRRDGFDEVCIERIRVMDRQPIFLTLEDGTVTDQVIDYDPPTYEVWEQNTEEEVKKGAAAWRVVEGPGVMTIDEIPIRPFITGERVNGSWRFIPPMQGAADTQIEHYQAETALKSIKTLTAYPMLAGNGITPKMEGGQPAEVPVGPYTALYAPPIQSQNSATHGEWKWIEPTAENIKFLAEQVEAIEAQLREIGRQPLVASQMTVVQAGMNAQKANSAIQAWALSLKNTLEECFKLTAKWLGVDDSAQVNVFTDFELDPGNDKGPEWLRDMAKRGRLTRETEWEEAQRRGILSGDFDAAKEGPKLDADAAKEAARKAAEAPADPNAPPANDKMAA